MAENPAHLTKAERRRAQRRKEQLNKLLFSGISILVIAVAGYFIFKAFYRPPLPLAKNTIDVSADMSGFDKKEIHVKVGEPVTIRLRSLDNAMHTDGGGKHQLAIDDLKVNITAPPEGVSYQTFTPDKPGEYTFYCDICCGGKANPDMNGRLVVDA
jgi:heme/copper-type cytochrome/quinol oxidase subunit 2